MEQRTTSKPFYGHTLSDELRFMLVLVGGLALLIAAVVYVVYQGAALYFNAVRDISRSADMFAGASTHVLATDDRLAGQELFLGLTVEDDIEAVAVYDTNGELFASYARSQHMAVPPRDSRVVGTRFEDGALVHTRPVMLERSQIGAVYLRVSLIRVFDQLFWNLIVGIGVVSLSFALAYFLSFRLQRRIAGPIRQLIDTARTATSSGDYSQRVQPPHNGELGELVDIFNRMLTEMEASNDALRRSAEYFLSLIEHAPNVVAILQSNHKVRFVNAAVTRALGYRSADILQRNVGELVHPHDKDRLIATLGRIVNGSGERSLSTEARLRHVDGHWTTHEITVTNLLEDPAVEGLVLDCRDVTAQREMERERRQAQEFLDLVFQTLPSVVFVKDARDLRYLRVNKAVEQVLGYAPESFIGKTDHDCFPQEQADAFVAADREVLRARRIIDYPNELLTAADGTKRMVHTRKVPVYHEDGTPRFLIGISENVTEQWRAAEASQISEQWYRTIMDRAGDPIFIHDLAGHIIDINQRACDALGYSHEELLKMSVPDIDISCRPIQPNPFWTNLVPGEVRTVNGVQRSKTGETWPVEVLVVAVEIGNQKYVIAVSRDVAARLREQAELTRARDAAEAANRAKSEFLAHMNHELRTPLNAILGSIDLLLASSPAEQLQRHLETIRDSAIMLLDFIDEILGFTSIEARGLRIQAAEFDVGYMLERVLAVLAPQAERKHVEVVTQVAPGVPRVAEGDARHLRQVLVNIVGNAIKYTDEGRIVVTLAPSPRKDGVLELYYEVADTGPGVAPENEDSIFEPFYQAPVGEVEPPSGTGLGLSISKRLVEAMGGTIGVNSTPGEGAKFWFRVPVANPSEPWRPKLAQGLRLGPSLLVAPPGDARDAVAGYLRSWNLHPDAVDDLAGAHRRLTRAGSLAAYRLVLIDVAALKGLPATPGAARELSWEHKLERVSQIVPTTTPIVWICTAKQYRPHHGPHLRNPVVQVVKPVGPRGLGEGLHRLADVMATHKTNAPAEPVTSRSQRDIRILVAEDHVPSREVMMQMLRRLGYEACAVSTGPETLRALEDEHFDVLLLDCQLPEMDGTAVAREVRARETGNERLLIIAVSATASAEQRGHCLAAGMDDYLPKPVRMHQLGALLALRLQFPHAGEEVQPPAIEDAVDETQPLDPAAWQYLSALEEPGRASFTGQLIDVFLEDAEVRMRDLHDAVAARDADALARCAHGLKAGCLQVGANRMVQLCKTLQQLPNDELSDRAGELVAQLATEYDRVKYALIERRQPPLRERYRR